MCFTRKKEEGDYHGGCTLILAPSQTRRGKTYVTLSIMHVELCNFYLRPKATQMYEHRCPSGRLSDCPDFLTTFPMSDYHEIGREGVSWKK